MSEVWLARDGDGEYGVYELEPVWEKDKNWFDSEGKYAMFAPWHIKALSIPTLRKGTKKKIRITVEVL